VVAVGPGKQAEGGKREPMEAKAGDRILFGRHCGTEIKIEDQDSVIVREEEILARCKRPPRAHPDNVHEFHSPGASQRPFGRP